MTEPVSYWAGLRALASRLGITYSELLALSASEVRERLALIILLEASVDASMRNP
jgi:hypothetical protein